MHWVTIYDINNADAIWHVAAVSIGVVSFDGFIILSLIETFRPKTGQTTAKRKTLISLAAGIALIASTAWLYTAWRDRWAYTLGLTLKIEGQVEEVRVEVTPGADGVFFQVGKDWFKLPYTHPSACYPQEGEDVALDATETANLPHQGPPAHQIYRLRLGQGCTSSQPAPAEPANPA